MVKSKQNKSLINGRWANSKSILNSAKHRPFTAAQSIAQWRHLVVKQNAFILFFWNTAGPALSVFPLNPTLTTPQSTNQLINNPSRVEMGVLRQENYNVLDRESVH